MAFYCAAKHGNSAGYFAGKHLVFCAVRSTPWTLKLCSTHSTDDAVQQSQALDANPSATRYIGPLPTYICRVMRGWTCHRVGHVTRPRARAHVRDARRPALWKSRLQRGWQQLATTGSKLALQVCVSRHSCLRPHANMLSEMQLPDVHAFSLALSRDRLNIKFCASRPTRTASRAAA